jgi:hypothetical protein
MKSTISIGSIMTTLTDMKLGDEGPLAEKLMPPAEKAALSPDKAVSGH